jgi:heme iron utilization protein
MSVSKEIQAEMDELVSGLMTVILSTVDVNGMPNASYTPYVAHAGAYFILVSGLAKHTSNLLQTGRCHALFIADEKGTVNPFARKRLSYACLVSEVDREDPRSDVILDEMAERFGPTIQMLRSLPDFRLMKLQPGEGTFVRGFGQAIPIPSRV